jgi:hypothetical protein
MEVISVKAVGGVAYILDSKGDVWKFSMHWDGLPEIYSIERGSGKVTDAELNKFLNREF